MRDISNLNDLYNAQEVILLCEISQNRFQLIYDEFMFNPWKCNSASTRVSCIQREQTKIILPLPTNNSIMKTFKKN